MLTESGSQCISAVRDGLVYPVPVPPLRGHDSTRDADLYDSLDNAIDCIYPLMNFGATVSK